MSQATLRHQRHRTAAPSTAPPDIYHFHKLHETRIGLGIYWAHSIVFHSRVVTRACTRPSVWASAFCSVYMCVARVTNKRKTERKRAYNQESNVMLRRRHCNLHWISLQAHKVGFRKLCLPNIRQTLHTQIWKFCLPNRANFVHFSFYSIKYYTILFCLCITLTAFKVICSLNMANVTKNLWSVLKRNHVSAYWFFAFNCQKTIFIVIATHTPKLRHRILSRVSPFDWSNSNICWICFCRRHIDVDVVCADLFRVSKVLHATSETNNSIFMQPCGSENWFASACGGRCLCEWSEWNCSCLVKSYNICSKNYYGGVCCVSVCNCIMCVTVCVWVLHI